MQNNIDYREIVQTVTSNVLSDVKSQLASMQPGIVNDIVKRVQSSLQTSLDSLANQLGDLQRRVSQLEQKSGKSSVASTIVKNRSENNGIGGWCTFTDELDAMKQANSNALNSLMYGYDGYPLQVDTQTRVLLIKIGHWVHIRHKGWIIYLSREDWHTYLIRENGTDQKDISSYFKNKILRFKRIVENGSDWIIEYQSDKSSNDIVVIPML